MCLTLCNPIDCSPPGPSLQAKTLECIAISFSKSNYRKKESEVARVLLFATLWTVAYQAPPPMEFSRVAISFFRGCPQPRDGTHISCFGGELFTTEQPGKPYVIFTRVNLLKCFQFFASMFMRDIGL